jgi:hypothetical protein
MGGYAIMLDNHGEFNVPEMVVLPVIRAYPQGLQMISGGINPSNANKFFAIIYHFFP